MLDPARRAAHCLDPDFAASRKGAVEAATPTFERGEIERSRFDTRSYAPPLSSLSASSDDIEVLDTLGEVLVLRFLALQLDLQPDLVGGIGEAQRVLVADAAGLVQVEEGLVEGLHAQFARLLHDLLDLVDLALEDQVGNQRRDEQHLDRRRAALAFAQRQQALRG